LDEEEREEMIEEREEMVRRDTEKNTKSDVDLNCGRKFLARNCLRESNGQARYAIKILRNEIIQDTTKLYFLGIMDMNSEAKLLSTIKHPNIIKLRATAASSTFESRFHEKYFLVLDRLYDLLDTRIHKQWKGRYERMGGNSAWKKRLLDPKGKKYAKLWEERIIAAYDLSSALDYIHKKRIIHRDLKPDNIGFDIVSLVVQNLI
jgi:serine/threonine protein kinase